MAMRKPLAIGVSILAQGAIAQAQENSRQQELRDILSWTEYQSPGHTEPVGRQLALLKTLLYEHSEEYFLQLVDDIDALMSQRQKIHRRYTKNKAADSITQVIWQPGLNILRVYDPQKKHYVSLWTTPLATVRQAGDAVAIGIRTSTDPNNHDASVRHFLSFSQTCNHNACVSTIQYQHDGRAAMYPELQEIQRVVELCKSHLH